jgi:glycosyltransferase involved in cell wall biosynthesis
MESILGGLRVCYLGHHDPSYARNRILTKALSRMGAQVTHVVDTRRFPLRYLTFFKEIVRREFDIILVGFPGHTDVPIGRLIASVQHLPLVFDAFISLYDMSVYDRKTIAAGNFSAKRYFIVDKVACDLADVVLLDTNTHISYFATQFGIPSSKFRRVWVGADDEIMHPYPSITQETEFTVFFYGSFIPLHGVEYIIEAAKILETQHQPVQFVIVGAGQTYPTIRKTAESLKVSTVRFLGKVPYEELPVLISRSHVCLGIFGTTPKAQRVIPNKVFDGIAVRRPVITADTPAIREVLTHNENVLLCPVGNGEALANAILRLKRDRPLREYIAKNGYEYFKTHFSISAIAKELAIIMKELLRSFQ